MGERLGELQVEQQEQWERRGLVDDQGGLLEQTEEEFVCTWEEILGAAYNDFTAAQTATREARAVCDVMNIAFIDTPCESQEVLPCSEATRDSSQSIDTMCKSQVESPLRQTNVDRSQSQQGTLTYSPQVESPHRKTNIDRSQSQQETLTCTPHVTVPIFGLCHQAPWELTKHMYV